MSQKILSALQAAAATVLRDVAVQGAPLSLQRARCIPPPRAGEAQQQEGHRQGYAEGFAKGHADGHAEGRAKGEEEARKSAAQAAAQATRELKDRTQRMQQELEQQARAGEQARVRTLDSLVAALPGQIEARLEAAEDDMLALCFEAVCRVLGERAVQPSAMRMQLAHAMASLHSRPLVAVHLHPDDLAALQDIRDPMPAHPDDAEIPWVANPEVKFGGCILHTPEGGLDARLETQIDALRDLLRQTRVTSATNATSATPRVPAPKSAPMVQSGKEA